jgi:hypothetical protein
LPSADLPAQQAPPAKAELAAKSAEAIKAKVIFIMRMQSHGRV